MTHRQLIEKAKHDKGQLDSLRAMYCKLKCYEEADAVRDALIEFFPETEEMLKARSEACKLELIFRMVDLSIPEPVCHLISETLKAYRKKGGKFDINQASDLVVKNQELFQLPTKPKP